MQGERGFDMSDRFLYFDHAATTPLRQEVLAEMMPYLTGCYGNVSSIYSIGRESKKAIEEARGTIANAINANNNEIFFTSGGTESDNWAIRGAAYGNMEKGKHLITSAIEHPAVLNTCRKLEREGFEVTYLPVDETGTIDVNQLWAVIRKDTTLISIMYANNEIGSIQPVREVGRIARERGVLFHTDAVQAVGSIQVDVKSDLADLVSFSAHKFNGPKGIGALYVRRGAKLENLMSGGSQERRKRPGTENVAGIVGMGKAIQLATADLPAKQSSLEALRDRTIAQLLDTIPYARLNGHPTNRLPGNVNFSFQFVEGESILMLLDQHGIAASSGSACTSGSLDPSHVLIALGLSHEEAHGSLRLSYGFENTEQEVDELIALLPGIITGLREHSPLYQMIHNK